MALLSIPLIKTNKVSFCKILKKHWRSFEKHCWKCVCAWNEITKKLSSMYIRTPYSLTFVHMYINSIDWCSKIFYIKAFHWPLSTLLSSTAKDVMKRAVGQTARLGSCLIGYVHHILWSGLLTFVSKLKSHLHIHPYKYTSKWSYVLIKHCFITWNGWFVF